MSRLRLFKHAALLFGSGSLALYLIGVSYGDDPRHFYIPSVLCAIVAATFFVTWSLTLTIKRVVGEVVRRDLAEHRAILAESIAAALEHDDHHDDHAATLRLIGGS